MTSVIAAAASANNDFRKGCSRGFTEVWCAGYSNCLVSGLYSESKKGQPNTEEVGYTECKEKAEALLKRGGTLEGRRAINRMKVKLDELNKQFETDSIHLKVTADFQRLILEDMWWREYKERSDLSLVVSTCDDKCYKLVEYHLKPLRDAIYAVAKDAAGREALEARIKEIHFGFFSNLTCDGSSDHAQPCKTEFSLVDQVLTIPGVRAYDDTSYTTGLPNFLKKNL